MSTITGHRKRPVDAATIRNKRPKFNSNSSSSGSYDLVSPSKLKPQRIECFDNHHFAQLDLQIKGHGLSYPKVTSSIDTNTFRTNSTSQTSGPEHSDEPTQSFTSATSSVATQAALAPLKPLSACRNASPAAKRLSSLPMPISLINVSPPQEASVPTDSSRPVSKQETGIGADGSTTWHQRQPQPNVQLPSLRPPSTEELDTLLPAEGVTILQSYFENVTWMYDPLDHRSIQETLEEAERHGCASIHPHRLACLFMALALGEALAGHRASRPNSHSSAPAFNLSEQRSQSYFTAASACLFAPSNMLLIAPTPDAIAALHLMVANMHTSLSTSDSKLSKATYSLLGLAIRSSQASIQDPACTKPFGHNTLSASRKPSSALLSCISQPSSWDSDHANKLAWELRFSDQYQSIAFGRPHIRRSSTLHCPIPTLESLDPFASEYSTKRFHHFKYTFAPLMEKVYDLVSTISHSTDSTEMRITTPSYRSVMELDKQIRSFEQRLPSYLLLHRPLPSDIGKHVDENELTHIILQRHMICLIVHKTLLFLHRRWFFLTLSSGQHSQSHEDPMRSPYGASFVAAINSATWHTAIFESLLDYCPSEAADWSDFALHAFSAPIIQAFALLRKPSNGLRARIHYDLQKASRIFKKVGLARSKFMHKALPILEKLTQLTRTRDLRTGKQAQLSSKSRSVPTSETSAASSEEESSADVTPVHRPRESSFSLEAPNYAGDENENENADEDQDESRRASFKLGSDLPGSAAALTAAAATDAQDETRMLQGTHETASQTCHHSSAEFETRSKFSDQLENNNPHLDDIITLLTSQDIPSKYSLDNGSKVPELDPLLRIVLFWHPSNLSIGI